MRLLIVTDFTEQFAYKLLRGILEYSRQSGDVWEVSKMLPSYKKSIGFRGMLKWAREWKADVVIGQFDPADEVALMQKYGIVAIAQDYISRFDSIPNITSDYRLTGKMVAERFMGHGFKRFAFFGHGGLCWSDDRLDGYRRRLAEAGFEDSLWVLQPQNMGARWHYEQPEILRSWLLSLPKPIGIFACDDNQASVVLEACRSCGITVPTEVAIIGVDNDEIMCNLSYPSLSSVDLDIMRSGYETARMASRMVRDRTYTGEDVVITPTHIVERGSSSMVASKDPVVAKAIVYIYTNRHRKFGVYDVLKEVPVSRRLLEQRFKKETGMTVYQFISVNRMDFFAEQLLTTSDTVSEIAARMDEPDTRSLSRRFQVVRGCTPSEFRRRELRKL